MKRTGIKRKSTTKRRKPAVRCSYSSRCPRRPSVTVSPDERLCRTHAMWTAKKLVGDYVKARDGRCVLIDFKPSLECYTGQGLKWCHLIPQGRYPGMRFEPSNAVAGCLTHHTAFDASPLERRDWCIRYLGREVFEEMELLAVARSAAQFTPDLGDVIRDYRERSAA